MMRSPGIHTRKFTNNTGLHFILSFAIQYPSHTTQSTIVPKHLCTNRNLVQPYPQSYSLSRYFPLLLRTRYDPEYAHLTSRSNTTDTRGIYGESTEFLSIPRPWTSDRTCTESQQPQ